MGSSPQESVEYFRDVISKSPEVSIPVAAIKALTRYIEKSRASTMLEFTKELEMATMALKEATSFCISVCAGLELFQRFATRLGSDGFEGFDTYKRRLADKANVFCERSSGCREKICHLAMEFIQDGCTILMHSYSRVVMTLLLRAAASNKRFKVLVTEARPNSKGYQAARTLQQNDIPADVILDSAVGHYMGKVDMVLSGAEGVVENGGIVNQVKCLFIICRLERTWLPSWPRPPGSPFTRWLRATSLCAASPWTSTTCQAQCRGTACSPTRTR